MAKPNYAFARRQRDLAKKQKQEEKRLRKAGTPDTAPGTALETEAADTQSPPCAELPPMHTEYETPPVGLSFRTKTSLAHGRCGWKGLEVVGKDWFVASPVTYAAPVLSVAMALARSLPDPP